METQARKRLEKDSREIFHALHTAQAEDRAIYDRLTSLYSPQYFGVPEDWFHGKVCLDAGCGSNANGSYAMLSMGAEKVHAFDLNETIFEVAPKRLKRFAGRYELGVGNVLDIPYPDGFFDHVHCAGVLHHSADIYRGLSELARVAKPGGTLHIALYGKGGIVRDIVGFLREKYASDRKFKSFVDNLDEAYLAETFGWILSVMKQQGDQLATRLPLKSLTKLFDKDLILSIKDRITAPVYTESSQEEITDWLKGNGFVNIKRLSRYPRYENVRRFVSPLYLHHDHELARMMYGSGTMQFLARKKK